MKSLHINQFFLFFIFLFISCLILIINKNINIQCFINSISDYFIKQKYNQRHCLKNEIKDIFDSKNFKNYEYYSRENHIFKGLHIVSPEETLDEIIKFNKSISRFGDGEFSLIFGISINFQKANKLLSKKLKNVLESNEDGLLIGIPDSLNFEFLDKLTENCKNFWINYFESNKFKLTLFNKDKIYYSSFISRFYIHYKDKSDVSKYIKKLKKIWEQKDILIVEGKQTRLGIGNELFKNTTSIKRIICPNLNAFTLYEKILNETLKVDKKKLILLAIGPTSTVLAYDLYKAGYQVIDIGHVDIEYEWYLRNATTKIKIEGKYVNEAKDGNIDIKDIKDKDYYNQIIAKLIY
jgi:glycosyltransferase family protein